MTFVWRRDSECYPVFKAYLWKTVSPLFAGLRYESPHHTYQVCQGIFKIPTVHGEPTEESHHLSDRPGICHNLSRGQGWGRRGHITWVLNQGYVTISSWKQVTWSRVPSHEAESHHQCDWLRSMSQCSLLASHKQEWHIPGCWAQWYVTIFLLGRVKVEKKSHISQMIDAKLCHRATVSQAQARASNCLGVKLSSTSHYQKF